MNVFSLSWAAAGLALLGLSLFPAGSLALGGAPAHLAVFLLLLALAALALRLLRREGLDRPRLLDALLPIGLAFFLRALLLDYQSADYQMFLSQWAAAFRDGGGFAAVKLPIGNYNAPSPICPYPTCTSSSSSPFCLTWCWPGAASGWCGISRRSARTAPCSASACFFCCLR